MTRASFSAFLAMLLCVIFLAGCPITPKPPDQLTAPDALFVAGPRWGHPPLRVQFSDMSKRGSSPIRSWVWDFGDGTVSTDRNPIHVYYQPGSYTVSLTVTTAVGSKTLRMSKYITVAEAAVVESIGPEGGVLESVGCRLTVPAGVLTEPVVFGITPSVGSVRVSPAQSEIGVSEVCTISADKQPLFVDVRNPLVLEFEYNDAMVPGNDQTSARLNVIANLYNMYGVPIIGEVEGNTLRVKVTGLPAVASYGVVYRPLANLDMFSAAPGIKTPTSYLWPTDTWRSSYSARTLQELTALRVGSLINTRSYDRRTWIESQLNETLADIRGAVTRLHNVCKDTGFISPALSRSDAGEYTLIFYPISEQPLYEYESVSELTYTCSPFGQIVIDPAQLIVICKRNAASLNADQAQEVDFANAFGQEFSASIFRGYDYPWYTATSYLDVDLFNQPTQLPYYLGLERGLATYLGQLAGGAVMARSLGSNEVSLLSEPLFASASDITPLYAYSSQDFLFYLMRKFELDGFGGAQTDPLLYIGDTYEGLLEVMRTRTRMPSVEGYADAMAALRISADIALEHFFGLPLSELYWEYARAMAYENTVAAEIRPSDQSRIPYTLNMDRFEPGTVVTRTLSYLNIPVTISGGIEPYLRNIPPLSTRVVVLNAGQVTGSLEVNANAYDWTPDEQGNSMRVKVYKAGKNGEELTPAESQLAWPYFGGSGSNSFKKAIIVISNVSSNQTYDAEVTARVK